jgi:hypothetical protein
MTGGGGVAGDDDGSERHLTRTLPEGGGGLGHKVASRVLGVQLGLLLCSR